MDIIIFIICVVVVIASSRKKKKASQKRTSAVSERNRNTQKMHQNQIRQMQNTDRQRELKQRLEQKYRQKPANQKSAYPVYQKPQPVKPSPKEESILERAISNVEEEEKDQLKEIDRKLHEAAGGYSQVHKNLEEDVDSSALIRRVYDLMITGYNGSMEFDRDFLAEGMDMLNRIQG